MWSNYMLYGEMKNFPSGEWEEWQSVRSDSFS
jgi:hypothetical protein